MDTLADLKVSEWVKLSPGSKPTSCKIDEKTKYKGGGLFGKMKMRCVVNAYMQRVDLDLGCL
jgi:hypothetical protein